MQLEDVERFENFRIPYIIIDNAYTNQKCDFLSDYIIEMGCNEIDKLFS